MNKDEDDQMGELELEDSQAARALFEALGITIPSTGLVSGSYVIMAGYKRLGDRPFSRYLQSGSMKDLKNAISSYRKELRSLDVDDPNTHSLIVQLGTALVIRFKDFEESRKAKDLDEGIDLLRKGVALLQPDDSRLRFEACEKCANALLLRYEHSGRIEDVDNAISFFHQSLALQPAEDSHFYNCVSSLGYAFLVRHQQFKKTEDLEHSITFYRRALTASAICQPDNDDYHAFLSNFASALFVQYRLSQCIDDLDLGVSLARKVLGLIFPTNPNRVRVMLCLRDMLQHRYESSAKMEDLEDAISLARQLLDLCPNGHPDRFTILMKLGASLRLYHQVSKKANLLEECITLYREALSLRPSGDPSSESVLQNLAACLLLSFESSARMQDLDDAIYFCRKALTIVPSDRPKQSVLTMHLAVTLAKRYDHSGRFEDLEESISLHRHVFDDSTSDVLVRGSIGSCLIRLYELSGTTEHIENAISLYRKTLDMTPAGDQYRLLLLQGLSKALLCRYEYSDSPTDVDESLLLHREILDLVHPSGDNMRVEVSISLAGLLSCCYRWFGRIEDVEESISILRDTLPLQPNGSPYRSRALGALANALFARFKGLGQEPPSEEIFMLYEQAATNTQSFADLRLHTAILWARKARSCGHGSTITAYRTSLRIVNDCLSWHPNIESQQTFLAGIRNPKSLASDAASAAIEEGSIESAVEFLEQGRAILWSKIDAYEYPLAELRRLEGGSSLADRFEAISAELKRLSFSSETRTIDRSDSTNMPVTFAEEQTRQYHILMEEWEDIVAKIRELQGFSNFLQAPPFETLRSAAAEGPVILVNISRFHSDAIILHMGNEPVVLPLPAIQIMDVVEQVKKVHWGDNLRSVLRYLWIHIVSPVVDCLTELMIPEGSRIWWCPTAELCGLPLHAAGPYRYGEKNLYDFYVSSYVSTLTSLIRARSASTVIKPSKIPSLLVVGQPSEDLQRVEDEVKIIKELSGNSVDVLLGRHASREAVLEALKQHSWVHLACHGRLESHTGSLSNNPFKASFELHDGHGLSLLDLIQARLPTPELAFLSACLSAAGHLYTPDENIHLSAAMQFCGFRSVVGTMWEMDDEDGPNVAKEFYQHMFRNGPENVDFRDSAEALHIATKAMRKNKVPLERWAPFIHIGA